MISDLKQVDPDTRYFAATLHRRDDLWTLEFVARWAGFPDNPEREIGVELRKAVPVEPEDFAKIWESQDQGWIVVNDSIDLLVFAGAGGNAFISEGIARENFAHDLEPHMCMRLDGAGFWQYNPNLREVRMRRPTRTQRKRILRRDDHRCQLCRSSSLHDKGIELHIHHIKPFHLGGMTIDANLITLCRQCHQGLVPHYQPELFWGPDGAARRLHREESPQTPRCGIRAHRRRFSSLPQFLRKRD